MSTKFQIFPPLNQKLREIVELTETHLPRLYPTFVSFRILLEFTGRFSSDSASLDSLNIAVSTPENGVHGVAERRNERRSSQQTLSSRATPSKASFSQSLSSNEKLRAVLSISSAKRAELPSGDWLLYGLGRVRKSSLRTPHECDLLSSKHADMTERTDQFCSCSDYFF